MGVLPLGAKDPEAEKEGLPSRHPRELQKWSAEQMNKLPWNKVGVDVRHGHAHAGIVVRIPRRFDRRDHIDYLLEHCMDW